MQLYYAILYYAFMSTISQCFEQMHFPLAWPCHKDCLCLIRVYVGACGMQWLYCGKLESGQAAFIE